MNHIDTVFESSSRNILSLSKNCINADLQDKILDTLTIKNRTKKPKKHKENKNFKKHPNILSSDSDISGKTSTFRNGYQKHQLVLYNCNDQIRDVTLKENTFYLFTPRHTESSLEQNSIEAQDFANSPKVDFMLKNDIYSSSNIKLNSKVKDSIESKPEVESNQRQSNNVETKKRQTDKKLLHFMQKTLSCSEDISLLLSNKIVLPDGQEDWQRRRIRNLEFSSRFQRNYLYQLGRQIIELQKVIRSSHNNHHTKSVSQCVLTAHQSMLQAFQAYHNHIPTCLGNVVVDKLNLMIDHAKQLLCIHSTLLVPDDEEGCRKKNIIESISERCNIILEKATELMAQPSQHVPTKKTTIKSNRSINKLSLKNNLRKRIESKLSMYSIPATVKKREAWKKSIDVVSNNKNAHIVQSRYKTAGFKHRPPIEKNKISYVHDKNKLFQKKSVANLKESPLATPKNEDSIKTMIAMIKEEEEKQLRNDKRQLPFLASLECLLPLLRSICGKVIAKSDDVVHQEQLENVLESILDMTLQGTINKENENNHVGRVADVQKNGFKHSKNLIYKSLPNLLHQVESNIQNGKVQVENGKRHFENSNVELYLPNNVTVDKERAGIKINQRSNKWKTVSVTGEKNAQLICIYDNSSTPEVSLKQPNPSLVTIDRESTLEDNSEKDQKSQVVVTKKLHTIKISRLPKSTLQALRPLSKVQIKSILQGKLRHAKHIKGNPMYCKTSKRHPWQIVDQIADNLLNEILLSLAQEIQVNSILESLYNSEFQ